MDDVNITPVGSLRKRKHLRNSGNYKVIVLSTSQSDVMINRSLLDLPIFTIY